MKFLRNFGLVALILTAVFSASAQAIGTEITTSAGLTLTYPDYFTVREIEPNTIYLTSEEAGLDVTIDFEFPFGNVNRTAQEGIENIAETFESFGGIVNRDQLMGIRLENGDGFQLPIEVEGTAMIVIAFNLAENGIIVYLQAIRNDDLLFSIQEQDDFLEILRSVSVDLDMAAAYFDALDLDIPVDARYIADMPTGVLQFINGIELNIVDGWSIFSEAPYIENSARLLAGDDIFNPRGMISILNYESTHLSYHEYRNTMIAMTAVMYTGRNDFSAERDLVVEELENGYILEYLRIPDDVTVPGNHYILSIDDTRWLHFVASVYDRQNQQMLIDQVEQIIRSVREFEVDSTETSQTFITPVADFSGIDPTVVEVVEADCYTHSNASEDMLLTYYQCPAGCANNGGRVWGTDIYTNDSAVCVAAIHAGITTDSAGGDVIVIWETAQEAYISSTRNNISTSAYGHWGNSFTLSPVPEGWWE